MELKYLSFIVIFSLLAASASAATFGGRKALAPSPAAAADLGFTHLDIKDPKVIQLANFAIDEFNKAQSTNIAFSSLSEAIQIGKNFELAIAAVDNKDSNEYFFNVSVDKGVKKVTSFVKGG
ncbi:hypothetical protein AAHA92_10289 [Salvia divinorum]|uniref:Cystatin domain-containing protein n=1 Tax=Salvia divinorum TaxID=28513 RepID=A0ABD1HU55_SALDI